LSAWSRDEEQGAKRFLKRKGIDKPIDGMPMP